MKRKSEETVSSTYVICASRSCAISMRSSGDRRDHELTGRGPGGLIWSGEMESVKIRVCRDDQVARFQKGSVYLWVKVKMLSASSGLEQCVPEEQAIITCVRQRYLPPGPHSPPGTSLHDDGGVPLGLTREGGFGSVVEEIKGAALACLQDRGVDKTGDGDKVGRGGGMWRPRRVWW